MDRNFENDWYERNHRTCRYCGETATIRKRHPCRTTPEWIDVLWDFIEHLRTDAELDKSDATIARLERENEAWRKLYDDTPKHKDAPNAYDFISSHNRRVIEWREANERLRGALSTVPGQIDHEAMWTGAQADISRLRARLAKAEAALGEAERIKNEAHLRGDHVAYDLMRTVLAAYRAGKGE